MNKEFKMIYKILKDKKLHSSLEISEILNLSDKTVRKIIKDLSEFLLTYDIKIISKRGYGYILSGNVIDENEMFKQTPIFIPNTIYERQLYIIKKLMYSKEYLKLENISDEIYVSTKTLSNDIKHIENILKTYKIKINRKPYYGIKIDADEINIRNFLIDNTINLLNENIYIEENSLSLNTIATKVYRFLKEENRKISDIQLQIFVTAIYITYFRNAQKYNIEKMKIDETKLLKEEKNIVSRCIKYLKFDFDENDILFLTGHFISNETMLYKHTDKNYIKEITNLLNDIIYYVNLTFKIDLSDDEEFYKSLYQHLLTLKIRLRFGIKVKNFLLDEIKKNMPMEYNISQYICNHIISKRYKSFISEEENAYIALYIHMNKGINKDNKKKNILIVCPNGKGVSKFLMYNYNNLFSEYSNLVASCGLNELYEMDIKTIDIIFSLVDIDFKINKPVYKINYFLTESEIIKIKNILKNEDFSNYYENIFDKSLFIYIENKMNKKEIITLMSNRLLNLKNVPNNIEQLIHEREKLGMTEIADNIAIPHSISTIESLNTIGVCILKKKTKWINNNVNLVFFVFLNNKMKQNEKVYELITKIISNKKLFDKISVCDSYEKFIEILNEEGI